MEYKKPDLWGFVLNSNTANSRTKFRPRRCVGNETMALIKRKCLEIDKRTLSICFA